jgi:hypothetical protein
MSHGRARRHTYRYAIVTACLVVFGACSDDGNRGIVTAAGQASPPFIAQMIPTSGPVGTGVTLSGSGFTLRGNTLWFGPGSIEDLGSPDERTLPFTVPDGYNLPYAGAFPPVQPGPHEVRVVNANGTSNSVVFTVTGR